MEKYEVPIPEEISETLGNLSNEWSKFQQTLIEADVMLKKNKVSDDVTCLLIASIMLRQTLCIFVFL